MDWIVETAQKASNINDYYSFNGTDVYITHPLPENLSIGDVLSIVTSRVPRHLHQGVDVIYVGQFKDLIDREVNAVFQDGAIYVTNEQDNMQDMVDDIVHEIAHSVESEYPDMIYEDGRLFKEFIGKRRRLFDILKSEEYYIDPIFKIRPEFDRGIDDYLYKKVGYTLLGNLVNGLFPSAYSCVSLREYFAVGFEEFFIGDRTYLKNVSPILYSKIESLASLGEN